MRRTRHRHRSSGEHRSSASDSPVTNPTVATADIARIEQSILKIFDMLELVNTRIVALQAQLDHLAARIRTI